MHKNTSKGFTHSELIAVLCIIAVLAALILPAFTQARIHYKDRESWSNMRQVSTMLIAYENDFGLLPSFTPHNNARLLGTEQAGEAVFELLAASMQMTFRSFNNPVIEHGLIRKAPRSINDIHQAPADGWGQTNGKDDVIGRTSYMYEPTTPSSNAASVRPILGDDINQNPWSNSVFVAFADAHVEAVPLIDSDAITELRDSIYSKPDHRPLLWGAGSNTRAWLH